MHTPMSVRSMGLSSSGHPLAGSGGPTEPLRHRRLCIAGSGPHAPRRTDGRRTSMGLRAVSGPRELRADARLEEPPAARPFWDEGVHWIQRLDSTEPAHCSCCYVGCLWKRLCRYTQTRVLGAELDCRGFP